MSLPAIGDSAYPTPNEVRGGILRAIRYSYARRGLTANILPGSDHFTRAETYASRVSIAIANNQIALADSDPLTAVGDVLKTLAALFGIFPRPAVSAAGPVVITSSATVAIPAGFQGTAPDGQTYQTITAATVANGGTVQVKATTPGKASNQTAGTVVTWDSAAIGALSAKAVVGPGGLTGGADADDDERLRTRLLDHLANPALGGNWASVVEWAEAASAAVEAAYCYPGVRGPAAYDVAVTAAGGDRTLSAAALAPIRAAVLAKMPGQNSLNLTSVTPNPVDVVIAARLPLPQAAGGAGGGWRAAVPWPAEVTRVTAYNIGTGVATVDSATAPTVGAPIGVWDPTAENADGTVGLMREYTVTVVGGGAGAWTITVQGGFTVSPLGVLVSAGAEFLVDYAAAFRDQVLRLGPGEKTTLPELLPLGSRHPTPDAVAPSDLTSKQLAALTDGAAAFPEILGLDYALRVDSGTATPRTSPPVPLTTADPPGVLTLTHLSFIYAP